MEEPLNQYGTSEFKDFSHVTINIDDLPSANLMSKPGIELNSVSKHDTEPTSRQPSPC